MELPLAAAAQLGRKRSTRSDGCRIRAHAILILAEPGEIVLRHLRVVLLPEEGLQLLQSRNKGAQPLAERFAFGADRQTIEKFGAITQILGSDPCLVPLSRARLFELRTPTTEFWNAFAEFALNEIAGRLGAGVRARGIRRPIASFDPGDDAQQPIFRLGRVQNIDKRRISLFPARFEQFAHRRRSGVGILAREAREQHVDVPGRAQGIFDPAQITLHGFGASPHDQRAK